MDARGKRPPARTARARHRLLRVGRLDDRAVDELPPPDGAAEPIQSGRLRGVAGSQAPAARVEGSVPDGAPPAPRAHACRADERGERRVAPGAAVARPP